MECKYLLLFVALVTGQDFDYFDLVPENRNQNSSSVETKCGQTTDEGETACVIYYKCTRATQRTGTCANLLDVCCVTGLRPQADMPFLTPPFNSCGIRNPNGIDPNAPRANENEAQFGEFPWMVAVVDNHYILGDVYRRLFLCGGSLIHPRIVLTAAHCVYNARVTDIRVRIGEWDSSHTKELIPYQDINVNKITVHEQFVLRTLENDVALLILENTVKKLNNVNTICLATQGQKIDSNDCFVSGWGKTESGPNGVFPNILKKIKVPTVPRQKCEIALRKVVGNGFKLHENVMCTGGEEGKDTCTCEGGGPLICPNPSDPKRYVQVGIISWGLPDCRQHGFPEVYADVGKFRTWIDSKLENLGLHSNNYTF